jgi:hypothetical protein
MDSLFEQEGPIKAFSQLLFDSRDRKFQTSLTVRDFFDPNLIPRLLFCQFISLSSHDFMNLPLTVMHKLPFVPSSEMKKKRSVCVVPHR